MTPCRFKEFIIEQMRSITIVVSENVVFRDNKLDNYRLIEGITCMAFYYRILEKLNLKLSSSKNVYILLKITK